MAITKLCPEAWTELTAQCFQMFLKGPGKVVMVAFCINGLNCFFKFLAWIYMGSASMFSGAIHSLSDTCNQGLLALDISKSVQTPDSSHLYGFSNMHYISSLISGVGIFMMGAGLSWYHGVMGLLHPQPMESLLWAYCILAGSLVFEGATLLVAINELRRSARAKGTSFYKYVIESRDPSTLLESDSSVRAIHNVKATDLRLGKVRFKGEVDLDERVVTRSYLEKQDFDQMMQEIQEVKTPEQLEAFTLKNGENIIDTLGDEVDRLEKELKKRNPEVRHIDLEIL